MRKDLDIHESLGFFKILLSCLEKLGAYITMAR